MSFLSDVKQQLTQNIDYEISDKARLSVIQELKAQDIDYKQLIKCDFDELVNNRIEKLQKNVNQVGVTAVVTGALALITGGL